MPTNRTRRCRGRQPLLTEGAAWWLEHGQPLNPHHAEEIGFEDPTRASWDASNLHFARSTRGVTRARLREMGFSVQIERHIAAGAPPDDWRR